MLTHTKSCRTIIIYLFRIYKIATACFKFLRLNALHERFVKACRLLFWADSYAALPGQQATE